MERINGQNGKEKCLLVACCLLLVACRLMLACLLARFKGEGCSNIYRCFSLSCIQHVIHIPIERFTHPILPLCADS